MSYLEEFQLLLETQQYSRFLTLWEEYAQIDVVEGPELVTILQQIEKKPFAQVFGAYVETVLPLWEKIEDPKYRHEVMRLILDLQTANSPLFADLAIKTLTDLYGTHPHFSDFLRLSGLRTKHKFQGAISNFELLVHLEKGNFVFHERGWGVGEVMSVSLVREHALIEFEGIGTPKDLSFENAFKNLIPLPSTHFLARRFGNPDLLEKEGKNEPLHLIYLLLQDLGPKTAAEIKDELCGLVIQEAEWTKWWQAVRSKLKKDTKIQSPDSSKERFSLRNEARSHETSFKDNFKNVKNLDQLITLTYQYSRDFPEVFKNPEIKSTLQTQLSALETKGLPPAKEVAQKIQVAFLLEDIFNSSMDPSEEKRLLSLASPAEVIDGIEIVAFRKRFLTLIREKQADWQTVFLQLLFLVPQSLLRDYIFKELSGDKESKVLLSQRLKDLLTKSSVYPEAFFWYFQKVIDDDEDIPLSSKESKRELLEAFFVLLHFIEQKPASRDLVKKMAQLITGKRYLVFRSIIEGSSVEYLQEVLLLASKCHTLSKQDQRILVSLCEVVQPSLSKKEGERDSEVVWTTAEGYKKIQDRIQHLGTVETVDNAKEIEAARALGDLRENSEYKFALERRSRLQGELKTLSRQLNRARILTKEDISSNEVCVGTIVDLEDDKKQKVTYTLLGPWDADPEKHILSFQSKLAQAMMGCKSGEEFEFQGEKYVVKAIKSFL